MQRDRASFPAKSVKSVGGEGAEGERGGAAAGGGGGVGGGGGGELEEIFWVAKGEGEERLNSLLQSYNQV
jgi:hypothetical protein